MFESLQALVGAVLMIRTLGWGVKEGEPLLAYPPFQKQWLFLNAFHLLSIHVVAVYPADSKGWFVFLGCFFCFRKALWQSPKPFISCIGVAAAYLLSLLLIAAHPFRFPFCCFHYWNNHPGRRSAFLAFFGFLPKSSFDFHEVTDGLGLWIWQRSSRELSKDSFD